MQKSELLVAYSPGELNDKKVPMKGVMLGVLITMLIVCIVLIYLSAQVKNSVPFIIVACSCLTTFLPVLIFQNKLSTGINKRNTQ